MRLTDLLILPVAALWQQKLRTMLTILGVVFGAFVLAASLSIGEGVQETIARESRRSDISRRVVIYPKWSPFRARSDLGAGTVEGKMTDARRHRLRKSFAAMMQESEPGPSRTEISQERLNMIAEFPNVERLVPLVANYGFALLGTKSEGVQILSARPEDDECRRRIVAGRFFDTPDQRAVVVSEFLAYRLGLVNDADVADLIGKTLRLEFRIRTSQANFFIQLMKPQKRRSREERDALDKLTARLPGALAKLDLTNREAEVLRKAMSADSASSSEVYTEEFTVVGVIRDPTDEENAARRELLRVSSDVLLPYRTAMDVYFRRPEGEDGSVDLALLVVDSEQNVKDAVNRVTKLGLDGRAAIEFIEQQQLIYLLIFGGMTCVAAVALLVSALGIANTMLMSVLERTREIGIMKAVGADNRHLQFIFLVEGALIGLLGAGLGLALAWAASYPGDAWIHSLVMRHMKMDLKGAIFVFPPWMVGTVTLSTVLVTTLGAVYPARHAARIDPVTALRHE